MKKIIMLLMISCAGMAQIKKVESVKFTDIGEVKDKMTNKVLVSLYTYPQDTLTVAVIDYVDQEYQYLTDHKQISFLDIDGTINQLYDTFMSFFSDENKKNKDYKQEFKLGNKQLYCSNSRLMGTTSIYIKVIDGGHFYLNEKQTKKLFGKKD